MAGRRVRGRCERLVVMFGAHGVLLCVLLRSVLAAPRALVALVAAVGAVRST